MPRRPPKSKWQPGVSGNPNGRPIGSTNQINNEIRDAFAMLLQSQIPNLQDWLDRAAKKDPIKALDLFTKISERFIPALSRTEVTGAEGLPFSPITINLPNIPKISLGEGASAGTLSAPRELGEGTSTGLSGTPMFLPAKEIISEGTPAEDLGGHYGHRQSVVSESPGHYGHLNSAVSGEDLQDSAGAPSQALSGDPGDGGLD